MKLGVYTAVLHDRTLPQALDVIESLGLGAAEINAGGFLPPIHIPIDDVLASQSARENYLSIFEERGLVLAGLNANGNPLHPNPAIGEQHANDLRRAIRAAGALGQTRVVTMSGLPGGEPGATVPNWIVNAWNSGALDVLDYQWEKVVIPFWTEINGLAADHGVTVAIEMHPQNVVFSPPTLKELVERTGATNVGAEMDPSHLFWQGMDPVAAVGYLGGLVVHAAAKDVRINENASLYGVLDNRFRRLSDRTECLSAAQNTSTSGPRTRPGTSSPSVVGTTPPSGPASSKPCTTSTRRWRSTSNTRTRRSAGLRASRWPPRPSRKPRPRCPRPR